MPKNRRRAKQLRRLDNLDKISNLPDDVLSCILSRLQIKDAVATSVLSKRWEDVWTNIPTLEFSDQFQRTNEYQDKIFKFKDIVDTVLYRHGGSKIENCRISCHSDYASASFYSWIWAVVCCSVQELTLQRPVYTRPPNDLPWIMFSCKTLVVLKITGSFLLDLPSCIYLPKLNTLHLDSVVYLDDASAERLFSACPCLEELNIRIRMLVPNNIRIFNITTLLLKRLSISLSDLIDDGHELVFKTNTPNLEYLTLKDINSKVHFVNPSLSLIGARISDRCAYENFQLIQNVRHLALSNNSMASLYNAIGDRDLPKLEHLSRLELGVNNIYNEWRLLPKLLESAPNLEVLVFPKGLVARKNNREFGRFYWRPLEHVPECLLFRLKTIEIRNFVGVPGEKHLVKCLLESSKVLEKMMIHCRNFLENKQWKSNRTLGDALNQIENMAKGFEACEVEFFYEEVHK